MKFWILILPILAGCGSSSRDLFQTEFFKQCLELYLEFAPNPGNLRQLRRMEFANLNPEISGVCLDWKSNFGKIYVIRVAESEYKWTLAMTVMHELGHCLHDLPHTEKPEDIMFHGGDSLAPGETLDDQDQFWSDHLEEKLEEMFSGIQKGYE